MTSQTSSWEIPLLIVIVIIVVAVWVSTTLNQRARRRERAAEPLSDLSRLSGLNLQWQQTGMASPDFELREGDKLAAILTFDGITIRHQVSDVPNPATGKSWDHCWTFKQAFGCHDISIDSCVDAAKVADFIPTTFRSIEGSLELVDGRKFDFVSPDSHKREFRTGPGQTLVSFTIERTWPASELKVDINPEFRSMPELPLMIMLGCYILAITVSSPLGI